MKKENTIKLPPAVILAGGLGTRLRPVYAAGAKSMAPVAGRPFLDYLLRWLRSEGVEDVIICVGYKRAGIRSYVRKGRKWGLRVAYSVEKRLLGTAGAIKKAGPLVAGKTAIVINGDTLLTVNLKQLMRFHRRHRAGATLSAVQVTDHQRYGALRLDRRHRITAFLEKNRKPCGLNGPAWINGGVYVLDIRLLSGISARRQVSLEQEVFPRLAVERRIYGFLTGASFIDIGVPDDFRRAQIELPQPCRLCHPHQSSSADQLCRRRHRCATLPRTRRRMCPQCDH